MAQDIVLLWGPRGRLVFMSELPLYVRLLRSPQGRCMSLLSGGPY